MTDQQWKELNARLDGIEAQLAVQRQFAFVMGKLTLLIVANGGLPAVPLDSAERQKLKELLAKLEEPAPVPEGSD